MDGLGGGCKPAHPRENPKIRPMQLPITNTSTLVISNTKRLSEILRDIRTSTYQICRIEEKIIRLITFKKYVIGLLELEIY